MPLDKLEDVDGLPFVTASTTSLPFIHVRHDRHVGNQTVCNEDDHVNSFLPGTSSGWEEPKRDQEELQCHHPENRWKPLKTIKKHGKPCLALYVVGFVAVVHYLQIEEISVQHV